VRVSVCVPAFERPQMTRLLIESFFAQDHADRELVIGDDSATDQVEKVVARYPDDRLVYRHHPQRLGFFANLEWVLTHASGDVLVLLGDDDLLARPDSLAVYAETFASAPTVGYACGNVVQIDEGGRVTFAYVTAGDTNQVRLYESGREALGGWCLSRRSRFAIHAWI